MIAYLAGHWPLILRRLGEHAMLTAISLAVASVIALPLGSLIARSRFADAALGVLGMLYTVPSLAAFALLVPVTGLGTPTAVTVLSLYGLLILTRGVVAGLGSVAPETVEAARASGMTPLRLLVSIELPLALPVLVAALRTAAVVLISVASIAAWVDAGGLGVLIFEGLRQDDMRRIAAGALAAILLAVAVDAALGALERRLSAR